MTLTIWGKANSRTSRPLWAAEECGVAYEHHAVDYRSGGTKTPEFLAMNPFAKIPALSDKDGVAMFESFAQCVYIAQSYGAGSLWPSDAATQARCLQWAFWAACEFEPAPIGLIVQFVFFKPEERDQEVIKKHTENAKPHLKVLEQILAEKPYLTGEEFNLADLCVASVAEYLLRTNYDFSEFPNVEAWLKRCYDRPAAQAVDKIRQDEKAAAAAAQ